MRHCLCLVVAALCFAAALSAQRRVDPRYSFHRVIAVVPLVGSGTAEDPIRGKHVPTAETAGPPGTGIIAFALQLTDDGKHAIVELVAVHRAALAQVLADHEPGLGLEWHRYADQCRHLRRLGLRHFDAGKPVPG
jgi:hypothetical protein